MSDINKREFAPLAIDGSNYTTWAMDMRINLMSRSLGSTIAPPAEGAPPIPDPFKYAALHLIRHHIHPDLKTEYMMEESPLTLWNSLKERYNQKVTILLPEAQREWSELRFQDFKSVAAYNSAIHKIVSKLKFCEKEITNAEMIDKTLGTFNPSMMILQQQYRQRNFEKHSELMLTLLEAEKHNEILMKNHDIRPTGSKGVPEAHANTQGPSNGRGQSRRGRGGKGPRLNLGAQKNAGKGKENGNTKEVIQEKPQSHHGNQPCYKCGCKGHWSRTCRTPKHLVELYQKYSVRSGEKKKLKSEVHVTQLEAPHEEDKSNDKMDIDIQKNDVHTSGDEDDLLGLELEDAYGDMQ